MKPPSGLDAGSERDTGCCDLSNLRDRQTGINLRRSVENIPQTEFEDSLATTAIDPIKNKELAWSHKPELYLE